MSEELLCQHCGHKGDIFQAGEYYAIRCSSEECPMGEVCTKLERTEAEAIAAWNRRYVCLDTHGKKVFAGDRVKCRGAIGEIVRFGCEYCILRDDKYYEIPPNKIELMEADDE